MHTLQRVHSLAKDIQFLSFFQERHLQDVIHAQQANRNTKHVVIPTPENAINVPYYEEYTACIDRPPSQYIRLPGMLADYITKVRGVLD